MNSHTVREINRLIEKREEIEHKLAYSFSSDALFIQAFTHRSFLNEISESAGKKYPLCHNERLEFLGDAIVNLFISEELFKRYPDVSEGTLSQYKALLVCEKSFSQVIEKLHIAHHLIMGRGERIQQSYKRASIAADLFEAIVGAIYIDGGFEKTYRYLQHILAEKISHHISFQEENSKATLQELLAKNGHALPEYILEEESGPQHQKNFLYTVNVNGSKIGEGRGASKKQAQKNAAQSALDHITHFGLAPLFHHTIISKEKEEI